MNGILDVAHQINDLVMGDPNADVLRGGHSENQVYHNAFLIVLMRKEPLETFISYLGWDLCFQFSLNPLRFSLTRETDTKMTRAKSGAILQKFYP